MKLEFFTSSPSETKKAGRFLAEAILKKRSAAQKAVVIGLIGDLGGGKTTFLQGLARGLKIKGRILSPTFIIMRKYGYFYHIDCYRLENEKELLDLGFKEIVSDPQNVVVIEWAEKVRSILPENTVSIEFKSVNMNTREILWKN